MKIAQSIAEQIEKKIYVEGDKLPSIRHASQQYKVSIATIQRAYTELENMCLAEARPQSGYYVQGQDHDLPMPSVTDNSTGTPIPVSINQGVMHIFHRNTNRNTISLESAFPHVDLLPTTQLQKIIRKVSKENIKEILDSKRSTNIDLQLRRQLAKRMSFSGCQISYDEIVTTNGCKDSLYLCLSAVANKGDIVAIETPTFPGLLQLIEALGMKALEIPTHPQNGINLGALKMAFEQWPVKVCVLVPSYNNPLGSCIPENKRQELVELIHHFKIPLIEDDLFGDLGLYGNRPNSLKSYDRQGLVLYCSSISKSLSSGLRVGWACPGKYQEKVEQLKIMHGLSGSTLPQMIVREFLATGGYDKHIRKLCKIYASNIAIMRKCILEYFPKGTTVTNPSGGNLLWVELPGNINTWDLYNLAIKKNIAITPGVLFSHTGKYTPYFRLNAAIPWTKKIESALICLADLSRNLLP